MPRWASSVARFTVTVDLPTPPLPDATITTLVVAEMAVSGAFWATLNRALAMAAAFSSWVSSLQWILTFFHARQPAHPAADLSLDLGPQRASGRGERHRDLDLAVGIDNGTSSHAQINDVATQLGVDHPPKHAHHVTGARQHRSRVIAHGLTGRHAGHGQTEVGSTGAGSLLIPAILSGVHVPQTRGWDDCDSFNALRTSSVYVPQTRGYNDVDKRFRVGRSGKSL